MRISDWSSDVCSSDLDVDAGGGGDAQKIDVDWLVAHRIELHVARQHALGLAVHLQVEKGGKETALVQQLHQQPLLDGAHVGVLIGAVNHHEIGRAHV